MSDVWDRTLRESLALISFVGLWRKAQLRSLESLSCFIPQASTLPYTQVPTSSYTHAL